MGRPAVKRRGIEDAAIRLFAQRGLAATTVKDIAAEAGVTEGALYRHYTGKNDMAWKLYCREVTAFTSELEPVLEAAGTLAQRLGEAVRFIYSYYSRYPDRLAFVMLTRQGLPSQHLIDDGLDPDAMIARFIKKEIQSGEIRRGGGSPMLLMSMLRGAVLEPIYMHRYGRIKTAPLKLAAQVTEACLRILQ